MISLQQTLDEQKDLYNLCADRPLATHEKFCGNGFYGVAEVYKRYANYNKPINGIVPHGVHLDTNWIWGEVVRSWLKTVFCYPEHREAVYKKHGKRVIQSAAPFVYAVEMMEAQLSPERKGTIFFPAHSTYHVNVSTNWVKVADWLRGLNEAFHPITICIYWVDYLKGNAKPFQDRGIKVVSAGHMFDVEYLNRFYHLCSTYKYAMGMNIGAHTLYSIKSGCIYSHIEFPFNRVAPGGVLDRDVGDGSVLKEQLMRTLKGLHAHANGEQLVLVNKALNTKYKKSPEGLLNDLLDT